MTEHLSVRKNVYSRLTPSECRLQAGSANHNDDCSFMRAGAGLNSGDEAPGVRITLRMAEVYPLHLPMDHKNGCVRCKSGSSGYPSISKRNDAHHVACFGSFKIKSSFQFPAYVTPVWATIDDDTRSE
ncbi:hypothetical protein BaRGS_00017038 [Batillaria attramentaria]|uniref:Uncharacterized protein n=1 Tax=Batillaria attramentaria TaxID=370345 RepID=A0ABD0KXG3_9CAEN